MKKKYLNMYMFCCFVKAEEIRNYSLNQLKLIYGNLQEKLNLLNMLYLSDWSFAQTLSGSSYYVYPCSFVTLCKHPDCSRYLAWNELLIKRIVV